MFNADDLLKLIKKSAVEAVNASKPANMLFGKVISAKPLKIQVEQKLILGSAQLILSRNVTDYSVSTSMNWETETAGDHNHNYTGTTEKDSLNQNHDHGYGGTVQNNGTHSHKVISSGNKTMTIHNALKVGEEVILMQMSGGQKYIVVDRIGKG